MKTQINLDNKAKFFALYWGQNILSNGIEIGGNVGDCDENLFLLLKPLSSITDEDAIVIGRLHGHQDNEDNNWGDDYLLGVGKRVAFHFPDFRTPVCVSDTLDMIDYLRSKGYALPWKGLAVKYMVQDGWIKLQP